MHSIFEYIQMLLRVLLGLSLSPKKKKNNEANANSLIIFGKQYTYTILVRTHIIHLYNSQFQVCD